MKFLLMEPVLVLRGQVQARGQVVEGQALVQAVEEQAVEEVVLVPGLVRV